MRTNDNSRVTSLSARGMESKCLEHNMSEWNVSAVVAILASLGPIKRCQVAATDRAVSETQVDKKCTGVHLTKGRRVGVNEVSASRKTSLNFRFIQSKSE